jgi:DNA-binding PadR family transcriptional regulator
MGRKTTLGELEELVLLAILRVGDGAYGVPIVEELETHAERRVSPASVYVLLTRLERAGLIRSRPEPRASGRPRRIVSVTEAGLDLLRASRRIRRRMWEGLGPTLGDA